MITGFSTLFFLKIFLKNDLMFDVFDGSYPSTRTFETFAIGIDEMPNVEKFCWAQSVGQNLWSFLSGDFFTFFPFVNYNLKGSTEWYAYKSNYYSFWFYDLMPENRNKFTSGTNEIKGFASSDTIKKTHFVSLWNRTSLTKKIKLNFLGLDTIANYYCKYYIIDDKTYNELNQLPIGIP